MSQAKVDRYKEQKRNREKIKKKEKREWLLTQTVLGVIAAVMVVWVGGAVYNGVTGTGTSTQETPAELETYTIDTSALDSFISGLSAD